MERVKRFYAITHFDTDTIRAWQGHQLEAKWLLCLSGAFEVKLIQVDNWKQPSGQLTPNTFTLSGDKSQVLYIPPGYVNGLRAMTENATLMVYSDKTLQESSADDFRYPADYWGEWNKL